MGKKKDKEKAMDYLSLDESAWKMFKKTGIIDYYLLYKKLTERN